MSADVDRDMFRSRESILRVLYHVVASYDHWREANFLPNELSDDAVRVGRECLKLNDWWPANDADDEATA